MYLFKFMFTSLIHQVSEKQDYFVEEKKKHNCFGVILTEQSCTFQFLKFQKFFSLTFAPFSHLSLKPNKLKRKS